MGGNDFPFAGYVLDGKNHVCVLGSPGGVSLGLCSAVGRSVVSTCCVRVLCTATDLLSPWGACPGGQRCREWAADGGQSSGRSGGGHQSRGGWGALATGR